MGCLRSSVLRRVLRAAFVDQNGLCRGLARRGEHDAPVGQVVRAHVMARRRVVVGELGHRFQHCVVLIDLPVGLSGIRVGLVRIQGQPQREHQLLAVGRRVEVPNVAHALSDRHRDVGLEGARAGLRADVEIAAGGGRDQVADIDIRLRSRGGCRTLDIGQRKIQRAGILGLHAGKTRRMSADAAGAADHDQRREQQCRQFQGTVTEFTRVQSVHVAATCVRSSVQRSSLPCLRGVIELNWSQNRNFVRVASALC